MILYTHIATPVVTVLCMVIVKSMWRVVTSPPVPDEDVHAFVCKLVPGDVIDVVADDCPRTCPANNTATIDITNLVMFLLE